MLFHTVAKIDLPFYTVGAVVDFYRTYRLRTATRGQTLQSRFRAVIGVKYRSVAFFEIITVAIPGFNETPCRAKSLNTGYLLCIDDPTIRIQ